MKAGDDDAQRVVHSGKRFLARIMATQSLRAGPPTVQPHQDDAWRT
ncbi:hypothetical protein FHR60_001784 [Xanthomonas arboricola]|uniref:Uncharacterized protein n=1 Tax=Xanthomonas cannabis TaxID=1885674 RepID=A0ABR6JK35_9XANT|nr:hypothetical protein [Xanthomonas cannabis]